jgi:hypothetical protein
MRRSDVGIQIIDNHGSPAMSLLNCNLYDMYPISDMTQDRMYNLYNVHTWGRPFLSLFTNKDSYATQTVGKVIDQRILEPNF